MGCVVESLNESRTFFARLVQLKTADAALAQSAPIPRRGVVEADARIPSRGHRRHPDQTACIYAALLPANKIITLSWS